MCLLFKYKKTYNIGVKAIKMILMCLLRRKIFGFDGTGYVVRLHWAYSPFTALGVYSVWSFEAREEC